MPSLISGLMIERWKSRVSCGRSWRLMSSLMAARLAGALEATIAEASGPLLVDVGLFDVYRGESLGPDRRSLAYRLRFQSDDRTLTDDEVGECRRAVVEAVAAAHGAELRG